MTDLDELVMFLTDEIDLEEAWDKFEGKYGIAHYAVEELINDLLPLCMIAESPLTKKVRQGFVDTENNIWLMNREVECD